MTKQSNTPIDDLHKLGVLYEAMQDDIKKILEIVGAGQPNILKIPKIAERTEKLEYDMATVRLATTGTNHDLKMIKIRTEKLDTLIDKTENHEKRITRLEHKAA